MFIGHAAVAFAAKPLAPRVSLALLLGWSVLFGLACLRAGKRAALLLGLLVFSHWVLDVVAHRPDLPLRPGSGTMLGLGLWDSVPATIAIECAMFAAGVWLYARSTRPRDRIGSLAFWSLVGFLVIIYFANAFGPPPPKRGCAATGVGAVRDTGTPMAIGACGKVIR